MTGFGGRRPWVMAVCAAAVVILTAGGTVSGLALARGAGRRMMAAAPPGPVHYQPPVDAPITDPFRPPKTPYGPGNRGIEYATEPGTPVRAAGDGVVAFAGFVAGRRYVTVDHADGVRTSYSYLAEIDVRVGQQVHGGDVIGTTGRRFQIGARRGDVYFDPATLWATGRRAVLVPLDGGPGGAAGSGG